MSFSPTMQNRAFGGGPARKYALRGALPAVPAIALALLVAGPWLQPGYIFGTDWPAPTRFMLPAELSGSAPLQAALAAVAALVGPEATGKILVFPIRSV